MQLQFFLQFQDLIRALRGPTPFEDMIFYLWTDSNDICTAYVKLKINHILFLKNDLVFEKITIFLFFEGYFFGNFQKNRNQKTSMLEEKQGQFWNLHRIPNKTSKPDFRFLFFLFRFFLD